MARLDTVLLMRQDSLCLWKHNASPLSVEDIYQEDADAENERNDDTDGYDEGSQ